ncbi:hypothetical protein B0T17DRAFT_508480 [Bombardia bombarda]|uniref:Uncharacterized protein n=1 Tax=Bombardia bombarda TaxID=252184 RepID=A0AA39X1D1_9PEZI|nr:hypothetical protein B0T17DRAFT_508480 [Bombardia bombarda]
MSFGLPHNDKQQGPAKPFKSGMAPRGCRRVGHDKFGQWSSSVMNTDFGSNSQVVQDIRAILLPTYDIAHICLNVEAAEAELPLICSGVLETNQSSGLGSNAGLPPLERRVPQAVIFGGGLPDDLVDRVKAAVLSKAPDVKPIQISREEIFAAGATGPDPEVIARLLRAKLAEQLSI